MTLFAELKRRNVIRIAAAYGVFSWLLLQVGDILFQTLDLPPLWSKGLLAVLLIGFPVALFFSWVYELTPEGLKKEGDVTRNQSITHATGRRLDQVTIGMVLLVLVLLGVDRVFTSKLPARASKPVAAQSAAPAEPDNTIAVLPFADLSAAGDQEFFADGITEEILNTLVRVPQLKVAARTSSFQFKGEQHNIIDIGARLGVATVLEGSVRKSGERVRITAYGTQERLSRLRRCRHSGSAWPAQLIKVADGFHLWSQTYDEAITDLFAVQNRIARQIAAALSVQLDSIHATNSGGTANPAAFDALVRGRQAFAERHLPGKRRQGIELFELATQIDPAYADAWAYYAYSMSISGPTTLNLDAVTMRQRMRAALHQALALAPDHPLALAAQGRAQIQDFDLDNGLLTLQRVTRRYPSFVEGQYALAAAFGILGANDQALATLRRVLALDPLNLTRKRVYAGNLMYSGRFDQALKVMEKLRPLGAPVGEFIDFYTFQLLAHRHGNWRSMYADLLRRLHGMEAAEKLSGHGAEYLQALFMLLDTGDPAPLQLVAKSSAWLGYDATEFAARFFWLDGHIGTAIAAVDEQVSQRILLLGGAPVFLQPAFKLKQSTLKNPQYLALWQRPEMRALARARIANGALQAIPQPIIDEVRSE